jgi:hypothetical protein
MFTLTTSADYNSSYKFNLVNYLRGKDCKKEVSANQDFKDLFEKIDIVEKLIAEINNDYSKVSNKYKLLFSLRDFERLFTDSDFKKEIMLYIKYKDSEG